jgi:hypothetical protein
MSNEPQRPPHGGDNRQRNGHSSVAAATVLILWESFETASAAKNACREMEEAGQLRIGRENMWKFDLLQMPRFCEDAAREAAEADWVIVAFENNSAPSLELQHWLDSWRASASGKPQSLARPRLRRKALVLRPDGVATSRHARRKSGIPGLALLTPHKRRPHLFPCPTGFNLFPCPILFLPPSPPSRIR